MKLTAVFLFAACLHVSARTEGQVITLSVKNKSLEKVLTEIKKQSGFSFIYGKELISKADPVSINVKDEPLAKVLDLIFQNQTLTYKISDNYVVISPKTAVFQPAVTPPNGKSISEPPPVTITGRVTDENGNGLNGATVSVRGTQTATKTDASGQFTIEANVGQVLLISYVGYLSKEIKIGGATNYSVELEVDVKSLEAIVVNKGYYTEKEKLSTSNVGRVTTKDIEKQPVNNPLLALQGRVPGLVITQTNGLSGGGLIVRIQGQNSLGNGNAPLYVIDGVPFFNEIPTGAILFGPLGSSGEQTVRFGTNGGGNALGYINPSDIESIEILKDADATAIYGSRAANGAILITTKRGKIGKTKVNVDLQHSWGRVAHKMDLLNTKQYIEMRKEAFANDGLNPSADPFASFPNSYAPDLMLWDTTRYTDWQDVLIGNTAQTTNANIGISGGNQGLQYLISANYRKETTVFPGDFSDTKGSAYLNLNNNLSSDRFHFAVSANYLADNNQLPRNDFTADALTLPPIAPKLYNADGTINWETNAQGASTWNNPLAATIYNTYQVITKNLIANSKFSYRILNDLELSSNLGYTNTQSNDYQLNKLLGVKPEYLPFSQRYAFYGNRSVNTWIVEPQISYKKSLSIGKFDFLLGSTFQQSTSKSIYLYGSGYINDLVLKNIQSAASVFPFGALDNLYKYNAFFGRLNYNWQDRYIINLTARRDGSSRFGKNNRFHNFKSIGGAWIFSNEKFLKNNSFLSFGKLKGSYGTTGSDQIGDYAFLNLYSTVNPGIPFQGTTGLSNDYFFNPNLQWEETRKLSIGADLGFIQDRILLNVSYSRNRCSNQLLSYSLPDYTGNNSVYKNFPATVQNTSWEFSVSTTNLKSKDLTWTTNINLTIPRNKLIAFPDLTSSTYSSNYMVGYPISLIKLYHHLGVDPATGTYIVADKNGNPTPNPDYLTDQTVFLTGFPKWYGAISNSFHYRSFQLDVMFQFVNQTGVLGIFGNAFGQLPGQFSTFGGGNQLASVMNRWQKTSDITNIQKFSTDYSVYTPFANTSGSDANYSNDASYVRLKNLSISYELPAAWKKSAHLQNCRFYIQGQNLLTFTRYKGLDPESQSFTSLPPLRVWAAGVQLGL